LKWSHTGSPRRVKAWYSLRGGEKAAMAMLTMSGEHGRWHAVQDERCAPGQAMSARMP
jgi:hypothetical protein